MFSEHKPANLLLISPRLEENLLVNKRLISIMNSHWVLNSHSYKHRLLPNKTQQEWINFGSAPVPKRGKFAVEATCSLKWRKSLRGYLDEVSLLERPLEFKKKTLLCAAFTSGRRVADDVLCSRNIENNSPTFQLNVIWYYHASMKQQ